MTSAIASDSIVFVSETTNKGDIMTTTYTEAVTLADLTEDEVTAAIRSTNIARHNATQRAVLPARVDTRATRDKYGRPCLYAYAQGQSRVHAVMCTLPKTARQLDPSRAYLVNDWSKSDRSEANCVRYFATRAAALAYLKALVGAV